jgi:hypothetical protein
VVPTLDGVGKTLGVTGERVRQVESKVSPLLRRHPLWLPALDAIALTGDARVCRVDELRDELVEAGFTRHRVDMDALATAAAVVGMEWTLVHSAGLLGLTQTEMKLIAGRLRKPVSNPGLGTLDEVTAVLAHADDYFADISVVRLIAETLVDAGDLTWADQQAGWYLSTTTNQDRVRFRNVARKMLSVASPLPVAAIVEGLRRCNGYRGDRGTGPDQRAAGACLLRGAPRVHPLRRRSGRHRGAAGLPGGAGSLDQDHGRGATRHA